jgi:Rrf2 family transcriptional regulator, nitric oxide-sensitive transcriptional repressor
MRLQISTGLAIFAALELAARDGRRLSVAEIGEKYGVSSHLAKVMHVMGRAGLVRSIRGAGGGYQFAGNARRITLLDVVQLFENLNSVQQDAGAADATPEGLARGSQRNRRYCARHSRVDHHRDDAEARRTSWRKPDSPSEANERINRGFATQ